MKARFVVAVWLLVAVMGVGCGKSGIPSTKTRKVTGRVAKVNESVLVIEVGAEQWELAITPGSQIPPDLKPNAVVVVEHTLAVKSVTVRVIPTPSRASEPGLG